jgi:hypothetical protein
MPMTRKETILGRNWIAGIGIPASKHEVHHTTGLSVLNGSSPDRERRSLG